MLESRELPPVGRATLRDDMREAFRGSAAALLLQGRRGPHLLPLPAVLTVRAVVAALGTVITAHDVEGRGLREGRLGLDDLLLGGGKVGLAPSAVERVMDHPDSRGAGATDFGGLLVQALAGIEHGGRGQLLTLVRPGLPEPLTLACDALHKPRDVNALAAGWLELSGELESCFGIGRRPVGTTTRNPCGAGGPAATAFLARARQALRQGDHGTALVAWRQAASIAPADSAVWIEYAVQWKALRVPQAEALGLAEALCCARRDPIVERAVAAHVRAHSPAKLAEYFQAHGHGPVASWVRAG